MSRRETKKFLMYDQNVPDFDLFNSVDSELIELASAPLVIYEFDLQASLVGKISGIDDLYNEVDIYNESQIKEIYEQGFGGSFDSSLIRAGEIFKSPKELAGYYVEPTWMNELTRLGVESVEEEITITFNNDQMMSLLGKRIKIGDVIKTFRGKIYRVDDAFIADEVPGWKYIHYRVICRKPKGVDNLILPK